MSTTRGSEPLVALAELAATYRRRADYHRRMANRWLAAMIVSVLALLAWIALFLV